MDGRRRKASFSCVEDELALEKDAAWAWYKHGSEDEGSRPTPEFGLALHACAPRPSGYKLGALQATEEADEDVDPDLWSSATSSTGTESSLLDVYEVERITRQLDLLIASNQERELRRKEAALPRVAPKRTGSFWVRHAVAMCGSVGSAVETRALAARRRGKTALSASLLGAHAA